MTPENLKLYHDLSRGVEYHAQIVLDTYQRIYLEVWNKLSPGTGHLKFDSIDFKDKTIEYRGVEQLWGGCNEREHHYEALPLEWLTDHDGYEDSILKLLTEQKLAREKTREESEKKLAQQIKEQKRTQYLALKSEFEG